MQDKISEKRLLRIKEVIDSYDCSQPLHLFLKDYFRSNPVMGSTDRRITGGSVYNYYRTGRAFRNRSIEEKITISNFLCATYTSPFTEFLLRHYSFFPQDEIIFPVEKKVELVRLKYPEFTPENIFPFKEHVSAQIDFNKFVQSFLIQPKVWIRVRENFLKEVKNELTKKNILFDETMEMPFTLGFENNINLQQLQSFKKGLFEVQDLSSQKTGNFISAEEGEDWWDCCAGAGGKSLMLIDKFPDINLLATDVRKNILINLEKRFKKAGIKKYSTAVVDLENEDLKKNQLFDGIICDVPCSGSGTWSRSPENISCFDKKNIFYYQEKQKTIVTKAASHIKEDGKLIYITCSVFKEENEEVVDFIITNTSLELQKKQLIDGTGTNADSMFVAVLKN
jgi:16S rRNA (cytosine967-C5)-methyltransferase